MNWLQRFWYHPTIAQMQENMFTDTWLCWGHMKWYRFQSWPGLLP